MERVKILGLLLLIFSTVAYADEQQRVIPAVKAVNLAPMDSKPQVKAVNLAKPETQQSATPIKVQATPVQQNNVNTTVQPPKNNPVYPASVQQNKQNQQAQNPLTTPVDVDFDICVKNYQTDIDNLFELTLAAIEANNFKIEEIQSKGGYITFNAANKEFLATVAKIDSKNSVLKINPTNGVYHFAPGIVYKIFEYITLQLNK